MFIFKKRAQKLRNRTFLPFMITFHNFALKLETGCGARVFRLILETRNVSNLCLCVRFIFPDKTSLFIRTSRNEWFVIVSFVLLITKRAEVLEILFSWPWGYPYPFFGKSLSQHPETLIILPGHHSCTKFNHHTTQYLYLLFGSHTNTLRSLLRGQPHSPDFNHCVFTSFDPKVTWSLVASLGV